MLAISTRWNALKQPDGTALIDELRDFGFGSVALSRHLTHEQIEQLKPSFSEIGQSSPCCIQNFCPILPGTSQEDAESDIIHLSSLDNDERIEAIRRTVQTMQLAIEMEIPNVILRLGKVDTYDRSHLMKELYEYGEREFEAFSKKVTEATEWRKRKAAKHHDAVMRSIDELNERALKMEICIAIENPPDYIQIPSFDEVELLFSKFYGSPMRYWHNVGHAVFQEKLGLCWSHEWLESYNEHLIGVSLHDLKDLEMSHPPGAGDIDWDETFPLIKPDVIKVMDIKHGDEGEVIQARELCEAFFATQDDEINTICL